MEYGGYLPFELENKKEFYETNEQYTVRSLNNGRTAIWYGLKQMTIRKVVLPLFYCPTVVDLLNKEYELVFYNINEEFDPVLKGIDVNDDCAIILVNYYGIMDSKIENLSKLFTNVIVDQAHSFFSSPIIRDGVFNVYSCRKFVGVPDGAYVIGIRFNREILIERECSFNRTEHLLKAIDLSTSEAYKLNLINEEYVGETRNEMSLLTHKILGSVNYMSIKEKRSKNFSKLNELLKSIQLLKDLPDSTAAYCYPLLLDDDIREELINRKVWVPTMWREFITDQYLGSVEYNYSKYIICLPIDQRYDESNMEELSTIVYDCIEKVKADKCVV